MHKGIVAIISDTLHGHGSSEQHFNVWIKRETMYVDYGEKKKSTRHDYDKRSGYGL